MRLFYYKHHKHTTPEPLHPHLIHCYDFTIVLNGTLKYKINNKTVVVQSNEAILIPPENLRERIKSKSPVNYASFNFHLESDSLNLPLIISNAVNSECKFIIACADEISQEYHANRNDQISRLLDCLLMNLQSKIKNEKENSLVSKIKLYIEQHLSEKITLEKIGEFTFFSPIYCESLFKKEVGMPIISYIIHRRVKEAKNLIFEGLPLKYIANTTGFESYSYFTRTFKKITGMSPMEYKKSTRKHH